MTKFAAHTEKNQELVVYWECATPKAAPSKVKVTNWYDQSKKIQTKRQKMGST